MVPTQPPFPVRSQSDLEKHDDLVRSMFERMQSYSRVIIGLAYAGLLAIWSATKQVLPERLLVWSGLLIVLSILTYVVFEIVQMFLYNWMSWRYADEVAKKGLAVALYENRRREKRIRASHLLLWLITFVIAALAGCSATGILVYAFCRRLLRLG